jgi:hypothetical protein
VLAGSSFLPEVARQPCSQTEYLTNRGLKPRFRVETEQG